MKLFSSQFYILIAFLVLNVLSCNQTDSLVNAEYDNNNILVAEEVRLLPHEAVLVSYPNLSASEKSTLWQLHLNDAIASDKYSAAQIEHIHKLKDIVSTELFEKLGTKELDNQMNKMEQDWFWPAIQSKLFTLDDLLNISTVRGLGTKFETGKVNATLASCDCRYDLGCVSSCYDNNSCATGKNPMDCGILGTSRCTGRCTPA